MLGFGRVHRAEMENGSQSVAMKSGREINKRSTSPVGSNNARIPGGMIIARTRRYRGELLNKGDRRNNRASHLASFGSLEIGQLAVLLNNLKLISAGYIYREFRDVPTISSHDWLVQFKHSLWVPSRDSILSYRSIYHVQSIAFVSHRFFLLEKTDEIDYLLLTVKMSI